MFLRSLKFKIAALFAGVFIVTSALLFLTFYLFQYNVLVREDRQSLEARTLEFWAVYGTGGAVAIQRSLNIETFLTDYDPFLLRIASASNETLAIYYPLSWQSYDIASLENMDLETINRSLRIPNKTGNHYLDVISQPLPDGNILQIGMSSAKRQVLLSRFRNLYLVAFLPIVGLSFLGGFLFSTRMLKPVNLLISVTRGIIETGSMENRLKVSGRGDELDELTNLFNQMLGRIESLIERMRMSLDNVAHDLRTPLTRLRQKLESASATEQLHEDLSAELTGAMEEADYIRKMLNTLMDISEAESGVMKLNRETVDLSVLTGDLVEFYNYLAEEKGVTLHCSADEPVPVTVDVDRVRQVVTNLLDNAVKYTRTGDRIEVAVFMAYRDGVVRGEVNAAGNARAESAVPAGAETAARGGGTGADAAIPGGPEAGAVTHARSLTNAHPNPRGVPTITVTDTGIGIPADDMPHIWDRLFRGDRSRSAPGLGLGLGLVKAIVEAHGGEVKAESEVGEGARFTITFPPVSIITKL